MKTLLLTAIFVCSLLGVSLARELHVDPAIGDDRNDGTTEPLRTIKHAIRIAEPGDTIHLKPVVYYEYAGFYSKQGEPEKPITLNGHGATLEGSDPIDPETWSEVSPGLFKNDELLPTLNLAHQTAQYRVDAFVPLTATRIDCCSRAWWPCCNRPEIVSRHRQ